MKEAAAADGEALVKAARHGDTADITSLLSKGVDVNYANEYG